LAQRSAQAAKEIKVLIEDSVSKVGTGSQQVERAGATMQEIVASVKRVTDIMGEISAASEEQSGGIDQVNRAVSQMDEVTQQNAALVEEAAAAAGSLQEQAQRLAEAVSVFKINAGEVIEVPARQLAGQHIPRVSEAPRRGEAAERAPQAAAPATRRLAAETPAEPARDAGGHAARESAPSDGAVEPQARRAAAARPLPAGASAARPARRAAPATPPAPTMPAAAATRRPAADDDCASFRHAGRANRRVTAMGVRALLLGLGAAAALAGCSTSGNNFDPGALSMLTPGESTLQEAAYALGAAPVVLYGQSDGGALALWSFKATFVTDGLYSRK